MLSYQRQCRSRQMWKIFTNSHQYTHFLSITKNDLSWLNNPFMASFNSLVCPLMLRTNDRCVESLNISVMSANVENIHKFIQYRLFVYYKKKLSWLNNLFMVMFQHIRMSSYAKNKLQMCWVTEHQCRSRQMWKIFTNSPSILTFCLLLKMSSFAWTIYSW